MITLETRKTIIIILTNLLSFIFFFAFNILMLIILARLSLTPALIQDLIKYEYDAHDIYEDNVIADATITIPLEEEVKKEETFEDKLSDMLKENNLPYDLYKYISNNDENINIISNIINSAINYSIGKNKTVDINKKDIEILVNNAITNYEEITNKEVEKEKIDPFISEFTDYFVNDYIKINSSTKDTLNSILYGGFFYTILIINIILLAIIIALNYKNINVLLNIFIPTLITGLTYMFVCKYVKDNIENYQVITTILNNASNIGKYITIISLIGIIIYSGIKLITYYQKKEVI